MENKPKAQNLKPKNKKRVAVGLSGGVDSSLSAALLVEAGCDVTGVFLECWRAPGCRVDEDRKDALDVAMGLEIPYKVLDFKKEYKERVVDYFYREYEAGRTPNPDTMCNREIKFGMFYDWAMKNGFDYVATGHYARVTRQQAGAKLDSSPFAFAQGKLAQNDKFVLMRGADEKKDQSYFLYQLRPEQLEHVLFPIGGMKKSEVREEAKKRGLKTASKPDSQGICFIGPVNVNSFLKERLPVDRGQVVIGRSRIAGFATTHSVVRDDTAGMNSFPAVSIEAGGGVVVGEHEGVSFYTIGQRLGEEIDQGLVARLCKKGVLDFDPSEMPALFVVDKDVENNQLVVGLEKELMRSEFGVRDVNWLVDAWLDSSQAQNDSKEVFVRIRNLGEIVKARFKIYDSRFMIETDEPMRAVAEGQACVFYDSDGSDAVVLGGGVIA